MQPKNRKILDFSQSVYDWMQSELLRLYPDDGLERLRAEKVAIAFLRAIVDPSQL